MSAEFYRIGLPPGGPQTVEIVEFDGDGHLHWGSPDGAHEFAIERSLVSAPFDWHVIMRGESAAGNVAVKVKDGNVPTGMVFVAGGRFTRGDILGDHTTARPVHTTFVSPFYMQKNEITVEEYVNTLQWGWDRGLVAVDGDSVVDGGGVVLTVLNRFDWQFRFGDGVFSIRPGRENHPMAHVSWFGALVYCNLRSMELGLEVCYDLEDWSCNFASPGFRLPTEAEWEIAARGGHEGRRFPWGTDTITHHHANYQSSTNNLYDISETRGFHPDYAATRPRSSPVSTFPPNGFGLFDLCGNVFEWVWDWSEKYPQATQYDPRGPDSGRFRIIRGGSWYTTAERATCAMRYTAMSPEKTIQDIGFRVARTWLAPANPEEGF